MKLDRSDVVLSPSGAQINLYRTTPPARVLGTVQINHGLAEHAARYHRFARFLAERGFAVYAHDHRGHGHTTAPNAPLGSFGRQRASADAVIADVAAVHELIAAEQPGLPVIVFGHSMGALIAMNFLARHSARIAGAAVWNGNFSIGPASRLARALLAWERFRLGSDVPSRLLPRATFRAWDSRVNDGRTPFDWLSRDRDEVDRYVADPLCGWSPSVGMWQAVFDLMAAGAGPHNLAAVRRDLPLQLVGGGGDPATEFGAAVEQLAKRMRKMGFSRLISTIYPETRHESLNELNRDLIMLDFARWAESVVSTAGPNSAA